MTYAVALLDFDHTIFDFDGSEALAFAAMGAEFGMDGGDHLETFHHINRRLWADVELGLTSPGTVHTARFQRLNDVIGLEGDPVAMAASFASGLGAYGTLYDGALEILTDLAEVASIAMITNGLSIVQRARIERLGIGKFFDAIVISEEVGATKPRPQIFDTAFEQLGGPPKSETVMVGDSLKSDIDGGTNYGIDTCWFNPDGSTADARHKVTHEISALAELRPLFG